MIYHTILKKHIAGALFLLFATNGCYATEVLKGDIDPLVDTSFSFPILPHVATRDGSMLYVGAVDDIATAESKKFSLSLARRENNFFTGTMPEKATINGVSGQDNPLYGTGIKLLNLLDSGSKYPLIVLKSELAALYLVSNAISADAITLYKADAIKDANDDLISEIVQIAGKPDRSAAGVGGLIFTAVKPNAGGMFGDAGSGIAMLLLGIMEIEKKNVQMLIVKTPQAIAFDKTSDFLKIGSDIAMMQDAVALEVNRFNSMLYVGLQITPGIDGARAMALGKIGDTNSLTFQEIVPVAVFDGANNKIIGTKTNNPVSIHEVKSMKTSTSLPYLIVRGGNGLPAATQGMVFALPLVIGNEDDTKNGTIAAKDAEPEDVFTPEKNEFAGRKVTQQATTPAQMPINTDLAALVGGGALTGAVNELYVLGDTVFAAVSDGVNPTSGIFYSQAIFDFSGTSNGKIKSWTQWRRYLGVTDPVFGLLVDSKTGFVSYLTGADAATVNMVKRTQWSTGDTTGTGTQLLNAAFGQVCGLFDLPHTTPALDGTTLLISVGGDRVVLGQTGMFNGTVVVPTSAVDYENRLDFENGTIDNIPPVDTRITTISGGALSEVGPLTAAELASAGGQDNQIWLFCAGCNGLAVLSSVTDEGSANEPLDPGFVNLPATLSFKKIGDYQYVRKLVSDGDYLYVLTDTRLDRIDVTMPTITPENISSLTTTIATSDQLVNGGSFLDIIVSGKLAVLATSKGLLRVANGNDITGTDVQWQTVPLAEGVGLATQLFTISATGRAQDVATNGGGNIYVLSNNQVQNRSRVHRMAIGDVSASAIDDNTVVPFSDLFVEGVPSYFTSFGQSRDWFATDGSFNMHARARELEQKANVKILTAQSRQGNQSVGAPVSIAASNGLPIIVNSSGSGSWVIANDLGAQVNE